MRISRWDGELASWKLNNNSKQKLKKLIIQEKGPTSASNAKIQDPLISVAAEVEEEEGEGAIGQFEEEEEV